jgi:hypothetical protein
LVPLAVGCTAVASNEECAIFRTGSLRYQLACTDK